MPPRTKNLGIKRKKTNDGESESSSKFYSFYSKYFINHVDSKNFKDVYSIRELVPSFTLDIDWFRKQKGFDFIDILEKQKLLDFLIMKGMAAPNLVKAFYTTLKYDHDSDILSAELKGTKINLPLAKFSKISHLPCDGEKLIPTGYPDVTIPRHPASWTSFNYQEAYASICHPRADLTVRPMPDHSLSTRMKLLFFVLSRNILPKSPNYATVNYEEALILWGLKNEKKINWANLVIAHMLKCKMNKDRDLPYTVLITKILLHSDISFLDEKIIKADEICLTFGARTIDQMHLELVGETWQTKAVGASSTKSLESTQPSPSTI